MKPFHKSRTLILNWLIVLVSIASAFIPALGERYPEHVAVAASLVAAANILLRHLTTEALAIPFTKEPTE